MARLNIDGGKLRKRRDVELELSVAEVAAAAGCHEDTLRNIELGHKGISRPLLDRLVEVLGGTREDYLKKPARKRATATR